MDGVLLKSGRVISITSRADVLTNETLQAVLDNDDARQGVRCACRLGSYPELELPLERFPQRIGHRKVWRLDRRSVGDDHHEDCPFNLGSSHWRSEPSPALVFGEIDVSLRDSNLAFRHVCRWLLSRAITMAALDALERPDAKFWPRFWTNIATIQGRGCVVRYDIAEESKKRGLEFRYGFMDAVPRGEAIITLFDLGTEEAMAETSVYSIPATLSEAILPSLSLGPHIIGPPYFVFVAIDRENRIARMAVFPVHLDARGLYSVESWYERWRAQEFTKLGLMFYKPMRGDDLNTFWEGLGRHRAIVFRRIWFRPDFLIYTPERPVVIEELRGIPLGKALQYDVVMERKREETTRLAPPGHVEFREYSGYREKAPEWHPTDYSLLGVSMRVAASAFTEILAFESPESAAALKRRVR